MNRISSAKLQQQQQLMQRSSVFRFESSTKYSAMAGTEYHNMDLKNDTVEDLRAFERRLVEISKFYQQKTKPWRLAFAVVSLCAVLGAWQWLTDSGTYEVSFFQSLANHFFFVLSSIILVTLFLCGIHRRVVAPYIIMGRTRQVLRNFSAYCDNNGQLVILKSPATARRTTATIAPEVIGNCNFIGE